MLSLLSNFWSRTIRTKAQLPWLSTRTAVYVQLTSGTSSSNREEERPPEIITGFGSRAGTTNCDASGLGGFVRRYLSTRNLRIRSNYFCCTMYLVSHSALCPLSCQTTLTKRQKKKKKKDCQMSVYHKADPGELIQWVTHESRSSAASGRSHDLLTSGTSDSCRPRGVVTRDFSAIFDRLPVRISTSDLHHWILQKKSFISELMILECSFPFILLKRQLHVLLFILLMYIVLGRRTNTCTPEFIMEDILLVTKSLFVDNDEQWKKRQYFQSQLQTLRCA